MKSHTKILLLIAVSLLLTQCAPPGEESSSSSPIAQKGQSSQTITQPLPTPTPTPPPPPSAGTTTPKTIGDVPLNCLENNPSESNMDDLGNRIKELENVASVSSCQDSNTRFTVNIQPVQGQTTYKIATNPLFSFSPTWGYGKISQPYAGICQSTPWILEFWMVRERQGQKTMLFQIWGKDLSTTLYYQNVDLQQGDDIVVYAIPRTAPLAVYYCVVLQPPAPSNALAQLTPSSEATLLNTTIGYKIYSLKLNFQ